jgi:ribosomal protein L24
MPRLKSGDRVRVIRGSSSGALGVIESVLSGGRHARIRTRDGHRWTLVENLRLIERQSYFKQLADRLLAEAEDEDKPEEKESKKETNDSLDSQVDEYLGGYEREAKGDEDSDFSVESYASDVVRLIENYDSLLEIRDTVVRRVINRLRETQGDDVVDRFVQVLKDTHDVEVGKTDVEKRNSIEAPTSAEAGPAGGGGGGA